MREFSSSEDDYHRLVDSIYESALDVAAMPAALDLFSRYTGTESPRYLIWDKIAGKARLGVTPNGCFAGQSLPLHDGVLALPAGVAAGNAGYPYGAYPLSLRQSATPLAAQETANLEHGVRLFDTAEVCVLISGSRDAELDLTDTFRHRRLSQVIPHWARAARLQQRNFELSGMAALGLASLDTLDFGVMVLQSDLRVRYANSWAESLVQADSHLSLDQGVLRACSDTLQGTLRAMLERAVNRSGAEPSAGSWMHITSGGQPVPIIVMPLVSRQPVEGPWQLPFAMMLMGNSESRSVLDTVVLTSLFGLSRKESIIAAHLAAGATLTDIAEREFLSPHTVRVHIRDILRKTGTHRQSELVRLLHLLPGVDLGRAGGAVPLPARTCI